MTSLPRHRSPTGPPGSGGAWEQQPCGLPAEVCVCGGEARCNGLAGFMPWLLRSASAQPVVNGVLRQGIGAALRLG